jgi:hypothetical protein
MPKNKSKLKIDPGKAIRINTDESITMNNIPTIMDFSNKSSGWECLLFGGDMMGIVWKPLKKSVPNFFWRFMQFICFGNRWKKIKK